MKTWLGALSLMIVSFATACSNASFGSCTTPAQGGGSICVDFGAGYSQSLAMQSCDTSTMSTFSTEACTSTNRVGRCTLSAGGFTRTISFYAPLTAMDATSTCTAQGGTYEAN
jgi:hypothetical protein